MLIHLQKDDLVSMLRTELHADGSVTIWRTPKPNQYSAGMFPAHEERIVKLSAMERITLADILAYGPQPLEVDWPAERICLFMKIWRGDKPDGS